MATRYSATGPPMQTPTVGHEPTTTRIRALCSADWARRACVCVFSEMWFVFFSIASEERKSAALHNSTRQPTCTSQRSNTTPAIEEADDKKTRTRCKHPVLKGAHRIHNALRVVGLLRVLNERLHLRTAPLETSLAPFTTNLIIRAVKPCITPSSLAPRPRHEMHPAAGADAVYTIRYRRHRVGGHWQDDVQV